MTEGDIVLTTLPQADGLSKTRPALLLRRMPGFGDWLLCGISTQLHQAVADFDDLILVEHADFLDSGLKAPSVIRLGFLAVLPERSLLGAIGRIGKERHDRLLTRLSAFLAKSSIKGRR